MMKVLAKVFSLLTFLAFFAGYVSPAHALNKGTYKRYATRAAMDAVTGVGYLYELAYVLSSDQAYRWDSNLSQWRPIDQRSPEFAVAFDEGASKGLSLLEMDGTAFSVTADATNSLAYGPERFLFVTNTTATGTVTPAAVATGLDMNGASVGASDEWTMSAGELGAAGRPVVIGTDGAFTACAEWTSTDVSEQAALFIEVTTTGVPVNLASSDPNYGSYCAIGQVFGDIKVSDNTTGATDTTDNWTDGQSKTLCILVSAAGACTYTVDGSAPTVTDAHTLGDGVPHVVRLQGLAHTTPATADPILEQIHLKYD